MFCLLKGHKQNFCNLSFEDFTIPIFEAKSESESGTLLELKTYFGESWQTSTLVNQQVQTGSQFAVKGIPSPEGVVRPSGPKCKNADGHLVLVDRVKLLEYDFLRPPRSWMPKPNLWGADLRETPFNSRARSNGFR